MLSRPYQQQVHGKISCISTCLVFTTGSESNALLSACKLLIRSLSFSGVKLSAEYRLTLLLRCSSFAYTDNRSENQSLQFGQDLLKPIVYSLSFSNHSKRLHEKMPIRNSRSRSEQSWNLCLVNLSIVVSIMDVSDCHLGGRHVQCPTQEL